MPISKGCFMGEVDIRSKAVLEVAGKSYEYYPVKSFEGVEKLPYSLTVLLENVLRCARTEEEAAVYAKRILEAGLQGQAGEEIEFAPARVLFQDFTGVPVFVDFAVMREACKELGETRPKSIPRCRATWSSTIR